MSVDINEGEFITILGSSGCGKTSLLNIMGTIDKPTKVKLKKKRIFKKKKKKKGRYIHMRLKNKKQYRRQIFSKPPA